MKKFLLESFVFLFILIIFIEAISQFLIITDLYLIRLPGKEIYYSISKSKKKNASKKLLLGDSVGRQLFDNKTNNKNINSLACNQAIGIIGQYFLLNNYLKTGNDIDTLFMVFTPLSFGNNLDQIYTYHYFLKPFYNSEYRPLFSQIANKQISKIPYKQFLYLPHIHLTAWAPDFHSTDSKKFKLFSPISIEYLKKIKDLSLKYNFKIILLPTPTSIEKKNHLIEYIDTYEIQQTNMEKEFDEYFKKIIYLDSSKFCDGTHLKDPSIYTKLYKEKWVK